MNSKQFLEKPRTDMFGEQQEGETNIASKFKHSIGNLKKGFDSADIVIEKEFNNFLVNFKLVLCKDCVK